MKIKKIKILKMFKEMSKRNIIVILLIGLILVGLTFYLRNEIATFVVGPELALPPKAAFYFTPSSGQADEGESFNVDLMVNTEGQNIVAASTYIQYDPAKILIQNIDTAGSVLNYEVENIIDNTVGLIKITRGQPGDSVSNDTDDGFTGGRGKIATISLKALGETPAASLSFLTQPTNFPNISRLILDDGNGTNVLAAVNNGSYVIVKPVIPVLPPSLIRIKLGLQGKTDTTGILFKVEIVDRTLGQVVKTYENVEPLSGGDAEIAAADVNQNIYNIRIVVPKYLSIRINDVSLPDDLVQFTPPVLLAGNLFDGDNVINALDAGVMNRRWGTSDSAADINQDGTVNTLDWGYVNRNWSKSGD